MGIIVGLGFFKAQITIGLLLMLVHPVGGAEPIVGALQTERYGGQIIKEMEHDYPTSQLYKIRRISKRRTEMLTSCCRAVVGYAEDLVQTPVCSRCGKELIAVDLEAFLAEEIERDHARRRAWKKRMKAERGLEK